LWLRRAAVAPVLSPDVRTTPSRCSLRCAVIEFERATLSESFESCGDVQGIDHTRLDRMFVAEGDKNEPISLPLYMYKHRVLQLQTPDVDGRGATLYTFDLAAMPPEDTVKQGTSLRVAEPGRLDAIAVWAEYDGLAPARTEHYEVFWLKTRPDLRPGESVVTVTCAWDRRELGCFGFDVKYIA
jgi:hypothetical protein